MNLDIYRIGCSKNVYGTFVNSNDIFLCKKHWLIIERVVCQSSVELPTSEHEQIQAIYIIYEYGYFIRYEIYIELYQKYNIQYIFFDRVLLRVLLGFVPTLCDCPVFLLITVTKVFVKENVRNYLRNFQFTNVPIFLGHSVYMPRYIGQKSTLR